MTRQEVRLWLRLRALRSFGFHFRRQDPHPPYIADFVCRSSRLIIEVDGGQHAEHRRAERDRRRDALLRRQGYRTLRFWNVDIDRNMEGIIAMILAVLEGRE